MYRRTIVAVAVAALTAGCGAQVASDDGAETVSLSNCGVEQKYKSPQKAVGYDMSALEKMFALGLADRMRGMVLPDTAKGPASRSKWAKDYERVENLSTDVLSLETIVDAKADWVLAGWNSGFSEERGITPKRLQEVGIASYQFTESCFNYGDKPVVTPPLEALYTDLEQIGRIFHVEDRADEVVSDIKQRFDALAKKRTPGQGPKTFIYDSGTSAPFTSGNQGMPHEIVERAGAEHIFGDLKQRWTEVGWEAVAQRSPEVIAVVDYGDQPVREKIAYLRKQPALKKTEAVRKNRFFVLDYGLAVSGPRNIDGAEKLAAYLAKEGL